MWFLLFYTLKALLWLFSFFFRLCSWFALVVVCAYIYMTFVEGRMLFYLVYFNHLRSLLTFSSYLLPCLQRFTVG